MEGAKGKENNVQEIVSEYKEKRPLFEEYTKTIHILLENLLRKHYIQFQTVQFRTKEITRFHQKLQKKEYLQNKKLDEMTDLSGCRVIFYIEETLDQLAKLLYDEFEMVEDEDKTSANEYSARHIVLKLKENRFSLPEY